MPLHFTAAFQLKEKEEIEMQKRTKAPTGVVSCLYTPNAIIAFETVACIHKYICAYIYVYIYMYIFRY